MVFSAKKLLLDKEITSLELKTFSRTNSLHPVIAIVFRYGTENPHNDSLLEDKPVATFDKRVKESLDKKRELRGLLEKEKDGTKDGDRDRETTTGSTTGSRDKKRRLRKQGVGRSKKKGQGAGGRMKHLDRWLRLC